MTEKVVLHHIPSYVIHKSVIVPTQGYRKYVITAHRRTIQLLLLLTWMPKSTNKFKFYFISSGRPIIAWNLIHWIIR